MVAQLVEWQRRILNVHGSNHLALSFFIFTITLSFQNELLALLKGKLTVSNFHIILVSIVVLENAHSLRFQSPNK